MKAGSQGPLAKALGLGGKPPEARARDDIVLSIMLACCCVYVYWGKMAREANKRHHLAAAAVLWTRVWTPPLVFLLVSPLSVVLCAAQHSIPHPIPTHPYRFVTSPSCNCAGVFGWFRGGGCLRFALGFVAPLSSSSTACLLPLLVLPFGTLGSGHPRSHHSVV